MFNNVILLQYPNEGSFPPSIHNIFFSLRRNGQFQWWNSTIWKMDVTNILNFKDIFTTWFCNDIPPSSGSPRLVFIEFIPHHHGGCLVKWRWLVFLIWNELDGALEALSTPFINWHEPLTFPFCYVLSIAKIWWYLSYFSMWIYIFYRSTQFLKK